MRLGCAGRVASGPRQPSLCSTPSISASTVLWRSGTGFGRPRRARRELHERHVGVVSGRGALLVARGLDAVCGHDEHRRAHHLEHARVLARGGAG